MRKILLSDLKYITPKNITTLKKNNINTVSDLLYNYPTKFDDYTITLFKDILPNTHVTIAGVIQTKATVINSKTNLSIMTFYMDVEGRKVRVTIFNRHFLRNKINYGVYVKVTGKFKENFKSFTASEIRFDEFSNDINPVFNIKGIKDEKVLEIKEKVLEEFIDDIEDFLPEDIKKEYQLINLKDALRYINIPENSDEINKAIHRIKFEELLIYQLNIKYMLYMRKNYPQGVSINFDKEKVKDFINNLPFKLTIDQNKSLEEILYDLSQPYKMNRLLQGEVGSGKTVVAAIALYAVTTSNYQGALMVPTEVLASQHFQTFTSLFKNINVNIALLTANISAKERKLILDDLENHKIDIVIGTHSLFQKNVIFQSLGLVVTDEEHRFGVKQRVSIVGKGHLIDHLKMSATPIPRTLAISVLGESDISIIKTMPGNKKEVITKYVPYSKRAEVINHIKEELCRGHQIYIVAPMINESEVLDLNNATHIYENMKSYFKNTCEVGLIHSKLKSNEKQQVMDDFSKNKTQILVATSVIEVGVNVINATTIVILDADRFGIAQLHQMRGRVRRSDEQAYCFLISDSKVQTSIDRLNLVANNSDGFVLAEEDLIIRGPGDFFGEKQTGLVPFKMADIVIDKDIFEFANQTANDIISNKKLFEDSDYSKLLEMTDNNYQENKEMLD